MEEALLSGTINGARLCRQENSFGILEEGYYFDAVVLKGDPSSPQFFMTENVAESVFQNGILISENS